MAWASEHEMTPLPPTWGQGDAAAREQLIPTVHSAEKTHAA